LEVLCDLGVKKKLIELKWPNDILVDKCKISGILLESSSDFLVAGIGVNISKVPIIETKWKTTKLYDHINNTFLIEDIALKILKKIMKNYELWNIHDFNNLLIKINPFIRNINKKITLSLPNKIDAISGVFLGIGENGGLKINKNSDIIEYFSIENFVFPIGKS
jgi:BirA family biotin operon repressor/biotin-[acetyl-CoA-carboxylase] ligase